FAAFNARGLPGQVVTREFPFSLAARHLSSGAVRARVETLSQAASFDDERFSTHRSGDDAVHTFRRIDCALARDEDFFAIMLFERNVVVMAVHFQLRFERLAMIEHLVED